LILPLFLYLVVSLISPNKSPERFMFMSLIFNNSGKHFFLTITDFSVKLSITKMLEIIQAVIAIAANVMTIAYYLYEILKSK
jgi:hypothetical protein